MTPGDIVMMLNEMGGMRVQATSPSLGAASVRMQGMRGRYTRFFSDGLPLFGEVGGLGLLQIPPMDLGQVEVIKGVASSLYGAGAMGGVVNLVSRRPGDEREREMLVQPLDARRAPTSSAGSRRRARAAGRDVPRRRPLAGAQTTSTTMPGPTCRAIRAAVLRPRVFWDDGDGRTFFATAGYTGEDRDGGTVDGACCRRRSPYAEALDTRRFDGGAVGQTLLGGRYAVQRARRGRRSSSTTISSAKSASATGTTPRSAKSTCARRPDGTRWSAASRSSVTAYRPTDVPQFALHVHVPGVFVQDGRRRRRRGCR